MHPAVPACPSDSKHKWSKKFKEFLANTLIKDFEARPRALALMDDPFLKEVIYIPTVPAICSVTSSLYGRWYVRA